MSDFDGMTDSQSIDYQTDEWVKGNPLHNTVRDECCPDFSCCNGGKMMPIELRRKLQEAHNRGDEETVQNICMQGLGLLFPSMGVKVCTVGEPKK